MSIRIAFALVNRASVNFVEAGGDNAGAPPSRSAGMRLAAAGGLFRQLPAAVRAEGVLRPRLFPAVGAEVRPAVGVVVLLRGLVRRAAEALVERVRLLALVGDVKGGVAVLLAGVAEL